MGSISSCSEKTKWENRIALKYLGENGQRFLVATQIWKSSGISIFLTKIVQHFVLLMRFESSNGDSIFEHKLGWVFPSFDDEIWTIEWPKTFFGIIGQHSQFLLTKCESPMAHRISWKRQVFLSFDYKIRKIKLHERSSWKKLGSITTCFVWKIKLCENFIGKFRPQTPLPPWQHLEFQIIRSNFWEKMGESGVTLCFETQNCLCIVCIAAWPPMCPLATRPCFSALSVCWVSRAVTSLGVGGKRAAELLANLPTIKMKNHLCRSRVCLCRLPCASRRTNCFARL